MTVNYFCLECGHPFYPCPNSDDSQEFCPAHTESRVRREWKIVRCTARMKAQTVDDYEIALPAGTPKAQWTHMAFEALENNRGAWVEEIEPHEVIGYEIEDVEAVNANNG